MHQFSDPYFKFSVGIPDSWSLLPSAWSPVEQMKKALEPEHLIQFASKPFCVAMGNHQSDRHAYPTLQVTARPFPLPSNDQQAEILQDQIRILAEHYPGFITDWSSHEAIIGGHRANIIRGSFFMRTMPAKRIIKIGVISRTHVIFARNHAFTVALSGSNDPTYYSEDDFTKVIQSVRIGA